MSESTIYELIGYAASILVVISLAMSSIIRLRIINLLGAVTFTVYGFLIGSIPVAITNIIITGLNIWYLRKELSTREDLAVIPAAGDGPLVQALVEFFGDDLRGFVQPTERLEAADVWFVMMRDATAAGVFAGRSDGSDLAVIADYVAPAYRDHKSGAQLYHDSGTLFADRGFDRLVVKTPDPRQVQYFQTMGYERTDDGSMTFSVRHA